MMSRRLQNVLSVGVGAGVISTLALRLLVANSDLWLLAILSTIILSLWAWSTQQTTSGSIPAITMLSSVFLWLTSVVLRIAELHGDLWLVLILSAIGLSVWLVAMAEAAFKREARDS